MANFCKNCGGAIAQGVKFCPSCGTSVEPTVSCFCSNCGKELALGAKFCPGCGTPVSSPASRTVDEVGSREPQMAEQVAVPQPAQTSEQAVKVTATQPANMAPDVQSGTGANFGYGLKNSVMQGAQNYASPIVNNMVSEVSSSIQNPISNLGEQIALSEPGEAVIGQFGNISGAISQVGEVLNPFKTLLSCVKSFFTGFIGMFKSKQWVKLIIAGVLALVWLVVMILSKLGIKILPLEWLTFANGGMDRSVVGWIGGLLGKTTVATMVFSLVGGGYKSLGSGFKSLVSGTNFKPKNLGVLLFGAGAALIIYQFFAGETQVTDTMAAISGALLSVRALGSANGFLYQMAQSIVSKASAKVRIPQSEKTNGLISGMTYGFTLGAMVSVIPFGWMPVIFAGHCIIAGVVLSIVFKNKKEESVK